MARALLLSAFWLSFFSEHRVTNPNDYYLQAGRMICGILFLIVRYSEKNPIQINLRTFFTFLLNHQSERQFFTKPYCEGEWGCLFKVWKELIRLFLHTSHLKKDLLWNFDFCQEVLCVHLVHCWLITTFGDNLHV